MHAVRLNIYEKIQNKIKLMQLVILLVSDL